MKNKSVIWVILFTLAIVLGTSCKKKPELVQEAPAPAKVEKKVPPLSIDQQMQKAAETAKAQDMDSYGEGNKLIKKWETFNSWEFVQPFQEKYLFDISYEVPDSRALMPVGVPGDPENSQTILLFHLYKNDPGKLFVPENAIQYWGTYKDGKTTQYFAWGHDMKELPRRNK